MNPSPNAAHSPTLSTHDRATSTHDRATKKAAYEKVNKSHWTKIENAEVLTGKKYLPGSGTMRCGASTSTDLNNGVEVEHTKIKADMSKTGRASVTSPLINPRADKPVEVDIENIPLFEDKPRTVTITLQLPKVVGNPGENESKKLEFKLDSSKTLEGHGVNLGSREVNGEDVKTIDVKVYILPDGDLDIKLVEKNVSSKNVRSGKFAGVPNSALDKFAELNPTLKEKVDQAKQKRADQFSALCKSSDEAGSMLVGGGSGAQLADDGAGVFPRDGRRPSVVERPAAPKGSSGNGLERQSSSDGGSRRRDDESVAELSSSGRGGVGSGSSIDKRREGSSAGSKSGEGEASGANSDDLQARALNDGQGSESDSGRMRQGSSAQGANPPRSQAAAAGSEENSGGSDERSQSGEIMLIEPGVLRSTSASGQAQSELTSGGRPENAPNGPNNAPRSLAHPVSRTSLLSGSTPRQGLFESSPRTVEDGLPPESVSRAKRTAALDSASQLSAAGGTIVVTLKFDGDGSQRISSEHSSSPRSTSRQGSFVSRGGSDERSSSPGLESEDVSEQGMRESARAGNSSSSSGAGMQASGLSARSDSSSVAESVVSDLPLSVGPDSAGLSIELGEESPSSGSWRTRTGGAAISSDSRVTVQRNTSAISRSDSASSQSAVADSGARGETLKEEAESRLDKDRESIRVCN